MSLTTGPTSLSPFVRGTSTSDVYFLQSGASRLVPDAATLNYMAQGASVRTLTDAAFQALPKGAPLPSRTDGTILNAVVPVGVRTQQTFQMQGGSKRAIPNSATLAALEKIDGQSHVASVADLDAIPSGAPMPSRADGTVYQGSGTTFAFLMKNAAKSAVPDATTLRDSGAGASSALSIGANDLAAIPDGAALPSTSKFLHPPSAAVPLVLLPVRLETRFQGNELWLRIYPDDIHVSTFEPELTTDESASRTAFLAAAAGRAPAAQQAFAALARQYGGARAAWIASSVAQAGTKAAQWTKAPSTNVLPERWIVMGYQSAASPGQVLFVGSTIADSLAVGPDPNGPGMTTDDGMRWMADFNRAIQVGMGCKIPLTGAQTRGFARIAVFGLRTDLTPTEATARLSDLIQGHHYTDGVELLQHAAPTNNTQDVSSAYCSHDPNYAALFALEQGPALCPARPTGDGDRLAGALGIDPALLAHVKGADGGQDEQAAAINTVMWPATWGYFLEQIVSGAVTSPDTTLPLAQDHFVSHVRARGHSPILRVGKQPYGISARPLERPVEAARGRRPRGAADEPSRQDEADVGKLGRQRTATSWRRRSGGGPRQFARHGAFVHELDREEPDRSRI